MVRFVNFSARDTVYIHHSNLFPDSQSARLATNSKQIFFLHLDYYHNGKMQVAGCACLVHNGTLFLVLYAHFMELPFLLTLHVSFLFIN